MFYQIVKYCFKNIYGYCKTLFLATLKQFLLKIFKYFRSLTINIYYMLTKDQTKKVQEFFKEKLPNIKCQLCNTNYNLDNFQFYIDLTEQGFFNIGTGKPSEGMKKIICECGNCGNMQSFSTRPMGL